jgi:hypothetical protein
LIAGDLAALDSLSMLPEHAHERRHRIDLVVTIFAFDQMIHKYFPFRLL